MVQQCNDYVAESNRVNRDFVNQDIERQLKALEAKVNE